MGEGWGGPGRRLREKEPESTLIKSAELDDVGSRDEVGRSADRGIVDRATKTRLRTTEWHISR